MEKIKQVLSKVIDRIPVLDGEGEEIVKQALVLPVLEAMEYNVWLPNEVSMNYKVSLPDNEEETISIAVLEDGSPEILILVKPAGASLAGSEKDLLKIYGACESASLGIVTNGAEWCFYSDTVSRHSIDRKSVV